MLHSICHASLGIIGGADGPTAIFITSSFSWPTVGMWVLGAVLAYLIGSLDFGILLSKKLYKDDIRTHGSGNAGSTNMLRTFGGKAAGLTVLGDLGKGAVATLLGRFLVTLVSQDPEAALVGAYIAAFCAVIGHLWPVWFHFKGGKGVATAAGAILATAPPVLLALAVVFFAEFFAFRMTSLCSITVAALYPVFTALYCWHRGADIAFPTVCAAILGGLVIWMHRSNIQRLRSGTEYKFDLDKLFHKEKKDGREQGKQ